MIDLKELSEDRYYCDIDSLENEHVMIMMTMFNHECSWNMSTHGLTRLLDNCETIVDAIKAHRNANAHRV